MTFPYFSPKSDVISVPFSHLSARRPLISFLLTFQVILSCLFIEYFPQGQRWSSNVLSYVFLFREETPPFSVFTPVGLCCFSATTRFILYLLCLPSYYLLPKEALLCIYLSHSESILSSCGFCGDFRHITGANFFWKLYMPPRIDNSFAPMENLTSS